MTVGPQGGPCTFTAKDDKLSITLDKPYGPGDTLDLAIEYAGSPDRGLHFVLPDPAYPEKPLSIWTQGEAEDTHHWLPCYDYPNDRATTEMIVTVEKPLFVLSNGVLVETKQNAGNTTTYHWKMDVPHVSYLISLAVADFSVYHDKVGDLPVDYYVAKHVDEATARRFMGKTPRMIRFFGEKTGQPYPYAKYAQVCVPEFGGGMENISATTMTDARAARRDRRARARRRRPGRARAGAPVVRRPPDLQGLVAPLAQRGLRLVLRPALHRARPRRGRVPARDGQDARRATWAATATTAGRSSRPATNRPTTCSTA